MKKRLLMLALPLAGLALGGCGNITSSSGGGVTTNTGGSITTPDGSDSGGSPSKSTSMEKALNYDYHNVTLGIDTLWNDGENETYYIEYYNGGSILSYTPAMAETYGLEYAFEEFYVQDGESYKWFDAQKNVEGSKGGWMQKGYHNADLSIWNANFYLPYALNTLEPEDFTVDILGNYYIADAAKRSDFIDEVFGWCIFDTEGAAYPVDVSFTLDSETSAIHKIYAFFDEGETSGDDDCIEVEFADIGTTDVSSVYTVHEAPNDNNKTTYWQYYGWPHDYQDAYYKSLRLEVASSSNNHVTVDGDSVTMDIDKTFGVNLIKDPVKFEAWDLVDEAHAAITYEYDESILEMESSFSYSKEFHSLKAGTTTVKATVLGENDVIIYSNEITVTVNEAPVQDLTNAVYKFSWVGYTDEENPTSLFANNDYGNGLPFTINTTDQSGTKILQGKNSDIFDDNKNILCFAPGHATNEEGRPSGTTGITFDFDDQQVSELSFNYASFYSGQINEFLGNLKSFKISTSNDGENWTEYDATEDLKEEVSDDFIKLFDVKFDAASKVKITFEALICGKNGTLGVDSLAFSTDETCHNHDTSEKVAVTGVTLSASTLDVEVDSTATLLAAVAPVTATDQSLTWSSSDESVATVSDGVVTGIKEGTTTVTVTTNDGGYTASCEVTVTAKPVLPTDYAGTYLCDDRDTTIVLDAVNNTATWTDSSYTAVLKLKSIDGKTMVFVNDDGDKITATKQTGGLYLSTSGSSIINGTKLAGNWEFTLQVTATDFSIKVSGITADSEGNYAIVKGNTCIVTATNFTPSDANVKDIVWTVTNGTGSGTYDEEYSTFTAVSAGTVTLTATMNGTVTKSVTFVISEPVLPTAVTITAAGGATTLESGKTLQLTATVTPSNADNTSVTWTSSDESVATVSKSGLVTAKSVTEPTEIIITAFSDADPTVSCMFTLTVNPKPTTGVVPAGMVGSWTLSDGDVAVFDTMGMTINADGTGTLTCEDASFEEDFEYDSVSGNEYKFLVNLLGDDYELIVTYDGSSITQVSFDDTLGYLYTSEVITFSTVTAA